MIKHKTVISVLIVIGMALASFTTAYAYYTNCDNVPGVFATLCEEVFGTVHYELSFAPGIPQTANFQRVDGWIPQYSNSILVIAENPSTNEIFLGFSNSTPLPNSYEIVEYWYSPDIQEISADQMMRQMQQQVSEMKPGATVHMKMFDWVAPDL